MENSDDKEVKRPDPWSEGHREYLHSIPVVAESHREKARIPTAVLGIRAETETPPVSTADTAVIVCHGMGQQVPFETLNQVASALLIAEQEHQRGPSDPPTVTLLRDGNNYLPRAQVSIGPKARKKVDLFEVYWAPITEGKVNTFDVLKFLVQGGWHGTRASLHGHFKRFLYDNWRILEIKPWTIVFLLMALVVVISLVLHYLSFAILVGAHALPLLGFHPFGLQTTQRVTNDCCWVLLAMMALLLLYLVWGLVRLVSPSGPAWDKPRPLKIFFLYGELIVTLLATVGMMGAAISALLFDWPQPPPVAAWVHRWSESLAVCSSPAFSKEVILFCLAAWAWVLWVINSFIVDYVGDVTAYISAHELNKFWTVREQIQAVALGVTRFVYKQNYKKIIFVGHSLGSVVAYDALNAIIREAAYRPTEHLDPVDRTKALITFGSPLDKTAFLFREHMATNGLGVREALAMAEQPVIADFSNWPAIWINIFSPADIISGSLEYYQLPPDAQPPPGARVVENQIDYEANLPLLAHEQYWNNLRLRKVLYEQCL